MSASTSHKGKLVGFDGSKYYKVSDRPGFSAATKRVVTQDYNATHGTSFDPRKAFAKANDLSIDHKVAYSKIAEQVVNLLNSCHADLSPTTAQTARSKVKTFRGAFVRYLYKGDHNDSNAYPGTASRNSNPLYADAKLQLAMLEKMIEDCYQPTGLLATPTNDFASICAAADAVLKCLNDSQDNLRYGNALPNSTIGDDFDGHTVQTPTHSHIQFTPHTKEIMSSSWADTSQFMMTPNASHFLTSDWVNPQSPGDLTPVSRRLYNDMQSDC